jgi:uncharacterized protein YbjT (DUF2867 family)
MSLKILVASATATTGSQAVAALSRAGAQVRALVRKLDDPRATALAALPNVELVAGDFDNAASISAALAGVQRALLVSGAFAHEQFERETLFIEAAEAAGLEVVVRIGTASPLVKPGTKGAYGRCHHGIDAFIAAMNYKVVTLNPNCASSPTTQSFVREASALTTCATIPLMQGTSATSSATRARPRRPASFRCPLAATARSCASSTRATSAARRQPS